MSLTRTRAWVAGTVVLCLLLSVATWFLLVSPQREEAAALEQQRLDTQASNASLQTQIETLRAQFADLPSQQAQLAAMQQAIPEEAGIANLVRDLDSLATTAGVSLQGITPGTGVLMSAAVAAPAATAAPVDAAATDSTAATDATGAVAASAPVTGDQLVSIPLSVSFTGDFFDAELYIRSLQTELTRAFLVSGLTITVEDEATGVDATSTESSATSSSGVVSVNVTGSVFVFRPVDAATATGATSAATGTAATPADTTAVATN